MAIGRILENLVREMPKWVHKATGKMGMCEFSRRDFLMENNRLETECISFLIHEVSLNSIAN